MNMSSEGDGDSWVFDSLVNFLHGNIWKIPVIGFFEEKSVVFDPDSYSNMNDEKEDEFRKIHEEYKALVDFMLSSFMEDIQVTPEQVEEACRLRDNETSISESLVTKVALEQLQAAEDFVMFRRIMTRKNIDLQLQSLELLVAKYGVLSPALRSQDASDTSGDNGEEDFLQVVIRYCDENDMFHSTCVISDLSVSSNPEPISSTIHKALQSSSSGSKKSKDLNNEVSRGSYDCINHKKAGVASIREEHKNLSKTTSSAANESALADNASNSNSEVQFNKVTAEMNSSQLIQQEMTDIDSLKAISLEETVSEAESKNEKPKLPVLQPPIKGAKKKSVKFDETTVAEIATVAPEQHGILTSLRKALEVNVENDTTTPSSSMSIPTESGTVEDIQRRREYLEAQRDKLVALKRNEREKHLALRVGESSQRPKSAKAAQMALKSTPNPNGTAESADKALAARRALAERLKHELFLN